MDWRVLLTTFGVIFLAEMGDKTQIAAMTMAAEKKRPWEVFIAASLALSADFGFRDWRRRGKHVKSIPAARLDQARGGLGVHRHRSTRADREVLITFHLPFDIYHLRIQLRSATERLEKLRRPL